MKMKNTLSTNSLIPLISSWTEMRASIESIAGEGGRFPLTVSGLNGSLPGFFIAEYMKKKFFQALHEKQYNGRIITGNEDFLIITPTQKDADECESDLQTILGDSVELIMIPWWDMLPYRAAGKGASVFGKRAGALSKLSEHSGSGKQRVFIASQRAFLTPLPPPSYIRGLIQKIRKGQTLSLTDFSDQLSSLGYLRVPKVCVRGEFSVRGEVIDVFMPCEEHPNRIVFDFDEISQIKYFDTETQASLSNTDSLLVYPMKEVVWTDELTSVLEQKLSRIEESGIVNNFAEYDQNRRSAGSSRVNKNEPAENEADIGSEEGAENISNDDVYLALTDKAKSEKERILSELYVNHETEGEELFYGILWDRQFSLIDYIKESTLIFCMDFDRLVNSAGLLLTEYKNSFRMARQTLPVLPPKLMLLDFDTLIENHPMSVKFRSINTMEISSKKESAESDLIEFHTEAAMSFLGNINYLKEQLNEKQTDGWTICIFADNPNQALRISEVVKEFKEPEDPGLKPLQVFPSPLTEGFAISSEKILVIQENEIFGRKKAAPKSMRKAKSKPIETFVDLTPGDFIVHVNYGIGLFKGIERIKAMGTERDYIKLAYAGEEYVFVPIEQVNLVQRYIGGESEHVTLDKIGSKSWNSRKAKVKQKVEEIAEKLIDLYSKRQASRGFPFPKDTEWQAAFEAAFPYEDTPDQFNATQDIKADMEKPVPMDRLVCGDVGYGKTEIAMRSAFKAVMGGKQVAFLAPTTILAEQHFENCTERFRNFPVRIGQLSRFVPPAEQKKIIAQLKEGKIDILVGTHRILQKDIIYKDLGLMIIDEEQRFGVKDKEKLKEIKTNIDCLALSATPIPRTLHMSLLKIRDMSLLTTPPQNRQPIETTIDSYSEEKVAEAIRREVDRGGQVFFLHNRVETLMEVKSKLERLLPEMLIDVAHGQMTSDELDDIFHRFKMGGFHILVATTIIENGIDIPNVNTIIIDRADMFGVSQLYQLRGRVGRSDRKAYAYLFYPENKSLSEVAMKRLQVISDFTELGSGFKIAMKDMEIRGAGNLLGKDQSGEVCAVGFEMYLNLLNSAIERLQSSNWQAPNEVLLELDYSGFIPDSYIPDAQTKMELYKKIANIKSSDELEAVHEEMFDRFGPVPEEVNSLLGMANIRILCAKLGIQSLIERNKNVTAEFSDISRISFDKLTNLIRMFPKSVRPNPTNPNHIVMKTESVDLKTKCEFIKDKLERLM